ncbi:hypothetical protein [Pararhodobacter sp. CCB-MM2]|uniref:hypothetical protein n=1 Tax=Pararhodobacter sp. CCB-MM2 TaxID=1786003 RepID=UPI00111243CF|nr:hypothetical protein [Pararhodobacter sp. CCB-MM2]
MSNAPMVLARPGDVVSFRFPFSEGFAPYARPCLILDASEDELLVAYGTTSRERANSGFEIRVNAEFAACGLDRPTRFVLARRIRVSRSDPRFAQDVTGTAVLGRLTTPLCLRQTDLLGRITASWPDHRARLQAERRGLHPRRGTRRCRAGEPFQV